jgi:hypothetical protein
MIKMISICLEIVSAMAGLVAAWFWLRASNVSIDLSWTVVPGDTIMLRTGWTAATMYVFAASANLNAITAC